MCRGLHFFGLHTFFCVRRKIGKGDNRRAIGGKDIIIMMLLLMGVYGYTSQRLRHVKRD